MTHDDRHWPRGAMPMSLTIGIGVLASGIAVVIHTRNPVTALALLAGLALAVWMVAHGMSRWLKGEPFPQWLGGMAIPVGAMAAVFYPVDTGLAAAYGAGLVSGWLLTNVWAIRAARANRPRNAC